MEAVHIPPGSQDRLINLSRQALESFVLGTETQAENVDDPHLLGTRYGAFVSLHKGEELRGCIGTCFPTLPLYQTVIEMTEAAASRDHRVAPLAADELAEVCIEISVLSPLEPVRDPLSLEVGKHGLYISNGENRGVLLPQVATEYGWDMETFLSQACFKAGLPKQAWRWSETKTMGFTALIIGEKG
jgi:AmmeMemoRadiSam system protein A